MTNNVIKNSIPGRKAFGRVKRSGRRLLSVLLVLAMLLQMLPGTVREAEASAADGSGTSSGAVQSKEIGNFSKVGSGKAVSNTYIFEVSTGTNPGGGTVENVLYFAIYYTTTEGIKRSAVLMPTIDALDRGMTEAAKAGERSQRISTVKDTFGYSNQKYSETKALGSVQTDQLLFTTPEEVRSFDRIQIFGRKTPSESVWTCQGMRIHKVDTLYGVDMAGWYSSDYFIDFDGTMVAEAVMSDGSGIFRWNNSGGCKTITGLSDRSGLADTILVNAGEAALFRDMYPRMKTNVGMVHRGQSDNKIVLRIDFSDQGSAGFEALAGSYEAGSRSKISDLAFCENAVIVIRYTDFYGCIRELKLPFMINALGQVWEALGDVAIAGFAQQGDSVAVPLLLPDYAKLNYLGLQIGADAATEAAELKWSTTDTNKMNIFSDRRTRSESDGINYTCVAVYNDVKVTVGLEANGATLKYSYTPGPNNPTQYATSTSVQGVHIDAGQLKYITLQDYNSGLVLAPIERGERYLVTMYTDDVVNAGTADNVYMQLHYISLKGKELVSEPYDVREAVQKFYGEWAGNVNEFAYQYGMSQGSMVQFIVPLEGVREFTDVSFRIDGGDEWQISGLTIAMLNSYEGRTAVWEEIASTEREPMDQTKARLLSHLRYSRECDTERVCFELGSIPDPENPIVPGDKNWEPGTLIQDGGDWTIISGEGGEVTVKEDIDWSQLSHYMTFEDTQQDLGFTKQRAVYTVTVKVAGEKVATGADHNPVDDDCGSANLFYFQLIFANGASGVTLANQQIVGDAFRTGTEVSFKIPTTQDYGDLVSIVVIPDDQDSNSNIYDKLKIDYITVSRESDAALTPSWAARGDEVNGLGWVGIEYRDPGEAATKQGTQGRTLSEIATTYQITESGYSAKLMVSITTGPYSQTTKYDENLKPVSVVDPAFAGGVSMTYSYFNTDGRLKTAEGMDIIKAMNEYMGRPGSMTRTYQDGQSTVSEEMDFYVSDPKYQFRAGHTDNFFITVDDIWQILDMQLVIRSSVVTKWNISKVSVYLVKGNGKRYINANGEYSFAYPRGEEPKLVALWNRGEGQMLSKDVQTYRSLQDNSIAEINISFLENEIPLDKATLAWSSVTPREPNSKNDTLNLYLYPTVDGKATDPKDYTMSAAIRFTDATTLVSMQSATGEMKRGVDLNGQTVFYAVGINAQNMDALSGVDVLASARKSVSAPIKYGILQRIRGGVLVETYYLYGVNNANLGGTMHATFRPEPDNTQRIFLQLPTDIPTQLLTEAEQDLAVALYFTPIYPEYQELRSKYIYLTDAGYTSIRPGQLLELDFDEGEIDAITSVNLVKMGSLTIPIEHAYLVDQRADGTVVKEYSIRQGTTPGSSPSSVPFNGQVGLLSLLLETGEDDEVISSGTNGPVRMTVGYYDEYGAVREKVYEDIRPYIEDGQVFKAGGKDMIRLLVPGLVEARYVDLEPWDEAESLASWKLDRLTALTGVDGRSIVRNVDQRIIEENPVRVFLSDVIMVGTVNVLTPQGEDEDPVSEKQGTVSVGETMQVVLDSGQQLDIPIRVSGSDEGVSAAVKVIDPETGKEKDALLDAVSDYDREYMEKVYKQAQASYDSATATEEEKAAAEKLMNLIDNMDQAAGDLQVSEDGKTVTFIPPRNFGDENVKYLLYVSSEENPDSKFLVETTVHTEASGLAKAIAEWNAVRTVSDVYVVGDDGSSVSSETAENESTLPLIIDSGHIVVIEPKLSEGRSYTASVVEILENGSETKPDFNVTHSYSDEYLQDMYEQANAAAQSDASSDAEKEAARKLMDVITAMQTGTGLFDYDDEYIRLAPPRNYTQRKLKYRIDFTAEETEEEDVLSFSVEVTVRSEQDKLQSSYEQWKALRTGGRVVILDAGGNEKESDGILDGDNKSVLIESGEGLKIYPRTDTGSESFMAVLYKYDPATMGTGKASLDPTHGYTDERLAEMVAYADMVLGLKEEDLTDGEEKAAREFLEIIETYSSSAGSFQADQRPVEFTPPRNYTGSNLYYKISVTGQNGETMFSLIISVQPEENNLTKAYSALQSVHEGADESNAVTVTPTKADGSSGEATVIPKGNSLNLQLNGGEGIRIHSRYYGREGYSVSLRTFPVTAEAPSLEPVVDTEALAEMKAIAQAVLNTPGITDEERRLAQKVMDNAIYIEGADGSFDGISDPAVFIPPNNFTDRDISYQISVNQGNEWLAIVVLTVLPEQHWTDLQEACAELLDVWDIEGTATVCYEDGGTKEEVTMRDSKDDFTVYAPAAGSLKFEMKERIRDLKLVVTSGSQTGDAALRAYRGISQETLAAYTEAAQAALDDPASTQEEIDAANHLLECINAKGSITVNGSTAVLKLPENYSGKQQLFQVKLYSGDTLLYTIDIGETYSSEADPVLEAYNALLELQEKYVGRLRILDENGNTVSEMDMKRYRSESDVISLELQNGQTVKFFFREDSMTSSEGLAEYTEPDVIHSVSYYDQQTLDEMKAFANETLAIEGVTAAETAAANKVLADIAAVGRTSSISHNIERTVTYTGVWNYQGTLNFTITIGTTSMGALDGSMTTTFAIINCMQPAGEDPLIIDYPALEAAREAGDAERAAAAATTEAETTAEETTAAETTEAETTAAATLPEETTAAP